MVLVSLLLVLAAAVALVIGLLQSGLAIIYVSIGCSVVAGILLAVAVVRGRPERAPAGMPSAAPQPAATSQSAWQSPQPGGGALAPEREPAMAGAAGAPPPPPPSDSTQQLDQAAIERAVRDDDEDLPIPDYDRLRATEVLPLLANLDSDELTLVRSHEVAGRNRFMVLSRIDRELESREPAGTAADEEASSEWDAGDEEWDASPDAGTVEVDDDVEADEADEAAEADDDVEFEVPARSPVAARSGRRSGSILDNYEQLKVLEILPRLSDLDADELAQVRRREQAGQRRAMIINRVDRLLVDARPVAAAPRRERATASQAPARRGRAAPAPAKKAPAAKSPARKAPAKKAPAKKAPARKTAKKAIRKAATKQAPAKKATVRTSTPTEKRSGAVRKTSKATKKR